MSVLFEAAHGYKVDPLLGLVIGRRGPVGSPNTRGYIQVDARSRGGRRPFAHRLIWEAVHGPIPDGMEINHANGVKADNRIANLELVTRSEQMRHAYATGLRSNAGDSSPRRRLDAGSVAAIRARHATGESITDLAREHDVNRGTVWCIVNGRTWKES